MSTRSSSSTSAGTLKCIICLSSRGQQTLTLKPTTESLHKLKHYANKRASFGETNFPTLCDRIEHTTAGQYSQSVYHAGCYKTVVNNEKLKRAEKRFIEAAPLSMSIVPPKKGRPSKLSLSCSTEVQPHRLRRSSSDDVKSCVFQCPDPTSGELHRVESEAMGSRFLLI